MNILGLTGPTGAGKGALSVAFARYNVPSLDTDAIYHTLLLPPSPCLDALVSAFGPDILAPDGTLNRPALAARVFAPGAPAELREQLNRITHRFILDECRLRIAHCRAAGVRAVIVDAPLLYESGFDRECDAVIAVIAPPELRLSRIMARDGLSRDAALERMRTQKSDDFYTSRADYVICNDGDTAALDTQAKAILAALEGGQP